ncbi:glycoside hydrolase family 28 protein [Cohnella silvisoli]|uniref:Glycosyl hydrolase family 28 protein n=1 Tax=Cohnella silvisoli TaxID=2873699 RepID=A0ABV1KMP4_9BACL|nr:glycosyl hydrolase family 28 protein [Cohnella silvisoli]MCD9020320.1 right-handed parallel beta-helix repeat-containing protein [Cohnella silvisoli]
MTMNAMAGAPLFNYNVRDYGAAGDGVVKDTGALNRAIADCHRHGGGTVRVPAGIYLTGTIEILSHVTLHLEAGSLLLGSPDIDDYTTLPYTSEFRNKVLITVIGVVNVSITGQGVIDGNSDAFIRQGQADLDRDFMAEYTRQGENYHLVNDEPDDGPLECNTRPGILILILSCQEVQVSNIKIRNSPNWCLHVARSEGVLLTGLEIRNSLLVPNADGIDVSRSRNVRISNCNIVGGDDGLAFSPCAEGYGESESENIVVENCTIVSRSAGIRLGWDACNFRNFLFHNIVIHNSNRGIGVYLREGESIENVVFSNIIIETRLHKGKWWGKAEPIHISVVPLPAHTKPEFTGTMGRIRNLTFTNITAIGEQGIVVAGNADSIIEDLTFDNVRITLKEGPLQESFGGNFDFRPSRDPRLNVFAHDIPALYASHVRNLTLRNVDVQWQGRLPEYVKNGLEIEHFEGLIIDGFSGSQPQPQLGDTTDGAAILLRNGSKVSVRNSIAKPGTSCFLQVEQVDRQGLFVHNDMEEAETMIAPSDHGFLLSANISPN